MNELESLHLGIGRVREIVEEYYATFPDQPELTPKRIEIYAKVIAKLYPYSLPEIKLTTDSAGAHMLIKVARDHLCCISTVENTIGLYSCYRHNDDLEAALENEPIYMGHLGKDWN